MDGQGEEPQEHRIASLPKLNPMQHAHGLMKSANNCFPPGQLYRKSSHRPPPEPHAAVEVEEVTSSARY